MFDQVFIRETLTPILAVFGAVLGLIGTVLGVLNYRLAKQRQSVRISLDVSNVLTTMEKKAFVSLELKVRIVNVGHLAVTVSEIGVVRRTWWFGREYLPISTSMSTDHRARPDLLPSRIEPHDEFSFSRYYSEKFFRFAQRTPVDPRTWINVYVKTSTGQIVLGSKKRFLMFLTRVKAKEGIIPATEWQA